MLAGVTTKALPSAGSGFSISSATRPPAPGRLSTIIWPPVATRRRSTYIRVTESTVPPGGKPMMARAVRPGCAAAFRTGTAAADMAPNAASAERRPMFGWTMTSPSSAGRRDSPARVHGKPRAKRTSASAVAAGCSGRRAWPARGMLDKETCGPSSCRSRSKVGGGAIVSCSAAT